MTERAAPFRRVLIANRGEIAVRIIRTCRRLGIETVAVFSDADRDALHVREADDAVWIGPSPATQSYLSVAALVDAATRSGADALHPGYGFVSESPELVAACEQHGIAFVGPPVAAMRAAGDKSAAREVARSCGVPVIPGFDGDSSDDAVLAGEAARIGFPVMVKAAAGGGGRGIRRVEAPDQLADALAASRREARSAFGDDRLLLERAVLGARHLEVQVLADDRGNVVYLGERDCTVQRRHQKIVEEAPSPALSVEQRQALGEAAVRVARAAGYRNAGTVEFLVDRDGQHYFLEINARLQVEHGVTELVTGLDLVELQLRVAAGEPLPFRQDDVAIDGHAIECRVYAEDPARDYAPSVGTVSYLSLPAAPWVRNDTALFTGAAVPPDYDPMIAKVLVHGPDRPSAVRRAAAALGGVAVSGVTTNLALLDRIVAMDPFVRGDIDLETFERAELEAVGPTPPVDALVAAAGHVLCPSPDPSHGAPWSRLAGWRALGRRRWEFEYHGAVFPVGASRVIGSASAWDVLAADATRRVSFRRTADGRVSVEADGQESHWTVVDDGRAVALHCGEQRATLLRPAREYEGGSGGAAHGRLGEIRAWMPGLVVRVLVEPGQRVEAAEQLVVIEAMKMEHVVSAPADGVVTAVYCAVGQQVEEDQPLLELGPTEPDDDATGQSD